MSRIIRRIGLAAGSVALAAAVAAPGAQAAPKFHGVDGDGNLVLVEQVKKTSGKGKKKKTKRFYSATETVALQYTPANDAGLVGIDERPISGDLYGVGGNSIVYRINPRTGVATGVAGPSTAPFTNDLEGTPLGGGTGLEGSLFGVDFNPTSPGGGAIRIVSDTNYNSRVSPDTGASGAMTPDDDLNGGAEGALITHVAYDASNVSTTQPTTTEEYALDSANDIIYVVNPPNDGTLTTPLDVSFDVTDVGGFDILRDGLGYVSTQANDKSRLYSLDTETGTGRDLGKIKGTSTLIALAVEQRK